MTRAAFVVASRYTSRVIRWSSRSAQAEGPPNAIAAAIEARRASGLSVLDLTLSNPTRAGFKYAGDALDPPSIARDPTEYQPDAFGLLSARGSIASHMRELGMECDPERMLLTASTSEAYGFLFKLLCDPGDEVLVPAPSYPLFEHLAQLEAVVPCSYPLLTHDNFRIDLAALREQITERTRAIVIVSPNNPTGSIVQRDELQTLATLGLPIISDEVFGEFRFSPAPQSARTALGTQNALVFSLFGLSKLVGLPQMKLAWTCVSGPDALVNQALQRLQLIADTYLSVGTPVQQRVQQLLEQGSFVREQIRARTEQNLATLHSASRQCPALSVLTPEGGWCAVLRVPAVMTEDQWVLGLLEETSVLVHPGYFYDFPHEAYLVLSLLPETESFARGVELLCAHVNRALT